MDVCSASNFSNLEIVVDVIVEMDSVYKKLQELRQFL